MPITKSISPSYNFPNELDAFAFAISKGRMIIERSAKESIAMTIIFGTTATVHPLSFSCRKYRTKNIEKMATATGRITAAMIRITCVAVNAIIDL